MQVKIIFLQTNYSLSDRQLEERLNFDLSWQVEEKARVLKDILEQNFTIDGSGGTGDKSAPSTPESGVAKDVEAGRSKGNRVRLTRYREKKKRKAWGPDCQRG